MTGDIRRDDLGELMDPAPLTPEEKDESFTCFGTRDFATGYQAFLDKRQPRFEGR